MNYMKMAPDAGFEPATKRFTAAYSIAELIRKITKSVIIGKKYLKVKVLQSVGSRTIPSHISLSC